MIVAAPAGVVFDLDGVLVLTSALHAQIWDEFVGHSGYPQLSSYVRQPGRRAADVLREQVPGISPETVDQHVLGMRQRFRELITNDPVAVAAPSAELLAWLSQRVPVGIATSSNRESAELLLGSLMDFVEVVVTSDECARGKPDPEPYQRTVAALRLDPNSDRVVAVEDTPDGVRSAKAAGLEAWTVAATVPAGRLIAAGAKYAAADLAIVGEMLRCRLTFA